MATVEGLTPEQRAVNYTTLRHMEMVRNLLNRIVVEVLERGRRHDQSKLKTPEVELFSEYTDRLAELTYGGPEYESCLKQLGPALEHHYANNRHHPEHFKNGVEDMNLIDLVEMLADWKAASTRHNDGNLRRSIEINGNRFGLSPQLIRIFENSIPLVEDTE